MTTAWRIIVRGRVQGVGYRAWTVSTARRLGLVGWVRNRRDGTVEIVAAGGQAALEALAAACRHGPAAASVASVDVAPADPPATPEFAEAPTA